MNTQRELRSMGPLFLFVVGMNFCVPLAQPQTLDTANQDSGPTQILPVLPQTKPVAQQERHRLPKWAKPELAFESHHSPDYNRTVMTSQFDGLDHLRITTGKLWTDGHNLHLLGTGIAFGFGHESKRLTIEPQIGLAYSRYPTEASRGSLYRGMLGLRAHYTSQRVLVESWVQRFGGTGAWINAEPLANVHVRATTHLNIGISASLRHGISREGERELQAEEEFKARRTPVLSLAVGPSVLYRKEPFDVGVSFKRTVLNGHVWFPEVFGSIVLWPWKLK